MKVNMGLADKLIRTIAAVAVLVLYSQKIISGTVAIVLLIIAGIFLVTSFIGICPLYSIFGIRTKRK